MKSRKLVNNKYVALIFAVLVALSSLTGCASAAATKESVIEETAAAYDLGAVPAEYGYDEEMAYDAAEMPAADYAAGGAMVSNTEELKAQGRKLIRNVYLSIESKDIVATAQFIYSDVERLGGYIESSSIYTSGYKSAYYTCRIPSDKVDEFLATVAENGNVVSRSENINDITLQYTDTESHKKALKAEEARLLELLEMAQTVEDMVTIEDKLTDVRYQLDSIESQLRTYDNQIDYTTVSIDITEVQTYTPPEEKSVWERIKAGLPNTIENLGIFFEDLFVGIVIYLPVIIILGVLAVIVVLVIKSIRKKKSKKAKEKDTNDQC